MSKNLLSYKSLFLHKNTSTYKSKLSLLKNNIKKEAGTKKLKLNAFYRRQIGIAHHQEQHIIPSWNNGESRG